MKVYRIAKIGELDDNTLAISEEEVPEPGPKEVLVRVRATSLNRRDLMVLRGTYPVRSRPGVIPLSDGAGEVVAIGPEVRRVAVGDRVAGTYFVRWLDGRLNLELASEQTGCNFNGMLTEYAVVNEESLVQVPAHLSWEALTAWSALTGPRPVLPGETVHQSSSIKARSSNISPRAVLLKSSR